MQVSPQTADRLLSEGVQPLAALARLLPPLRGRARRPATLARWIEQGDRRTGVRLEGVRVGGVWHSSRQALARYLAALSTGQDPSASLDRERLERQAAEARAERERIWQRARKQTEGNAR